jgi:hypothetical protein
MAELDHKELLPYNPRGVNFKRMETNPRYLPVSQSLLSTDKSSYKIENSKQRKMYPRTTSVIGVKDIILGRGSFKHIGNHFFRNYIDIYVHEYFHTPTRDGKSRIIEESLYELSLSGYRFLKEVDPREMIILEPKLCRSKVCFETYLIIQRASSHPANDIRSHMLFETVVFTLRRMSALVVD